MNSLAKMMIRLSPLVLRTADQRLMDLRRKKGLDSGLTPTRDIGLLAHPAIDEPRDIAETIGVNVP
jgi:hypothetical protein